MNVSGVETVSPTATLPTARPRGLEDFRLVEREVQLLSSRLVSATRRTTEVTRRGTVRQVRLENRSQGARASPGRQGARVVRLTSMCLFLPIGCLSWQLTRVSYEGHRVRKRDQMDRVE